ncbi:unnamed protein product [Rhizophagus irregularis]|nr:unnamed protein product [Rhizophagus irregularis]CAB5371674.1 unnamed protein product [Rhizophagus irregularis]
MSKFFSNPIIAQEILKHYFNQEGTYINKIINLNINREFHIEVEFYLRKNGVPWDVPINFISNENAKKNAALLKEERIRIPKTFWLDTDFDNEKYDDFYSNHFNKFSYI